MAILRLIRELLFKFLLLPLQAPSAVCQPWLEHGILGMEGWIERDPLSLLCGDDFGLILQTKPVQSDLRPLCPLRESAPGAAVVGFGDDCIDVLVACFGTLAHLPKRVAPIAIGGLAVRVDLGGTSKPLAGAAVHVLLEIGIANKERGLIVAGIEN